MKPFYDDGRGIVIYHGDWIEQLKNLPDGSVQCCVTSPPYWGLRDYGVSGQLGLEKTPLEYIEKLVCGFREVKRVLKDDGTLWLNLGDSYARQAGDDSTKLTDSGMRTGRTGRSNLLFKSGNNIPAPGLKAKDLVGIPWLVAFALRNDGWWLRSDIIWHKPNPMPESVTDRPTRSHEYIFLLSKSARYYYDQDSIREPQKPESLKRLKTGWNGNKKRGWPGNAHNNFDRYMGKSDEEIESLKPANKRTVWTITTQSYEESHFATFPPDLIKPCILAGSRPGDTILDPFFGSGTSGMVALELGRKAIGIELNPDYVKMAESRCNVTPGLSL